SWLNAGGAVSLEEMLDLIKACDTYFKPRLDRYKYPPRYPDADPVLSRDEAAAWLRQLDERLSVQSHLFGERASLGDMAIAPFVRQFAHTDKEWFDAQEWAGLSHWLSTWIESKLFDQVMYNYKPWDESASGEVFPPNSTGASQSGNAGELYRDYCAPQEAKAWLKQNAASRPRRRDNTHQLIPFPARRENSPR